MPLEKYVELVKNNQIEELSVYLSENTDDNVLIDIMVRISSYNRFEMAEMIISHFNYQDQLYDNIAITNAIRAKSVPIVKLFLDNGTDPNGFADKKCFFNMQAHLIVWTAMYGNLDIFLLLIQYGADPCINNAEAFVKACHYDNNGIAQYFIDNGIDVNIQNGEALYASYCRNNLDLMEILLKKGADPNLCRRNLLSNAIGIQNYDMIKLLFDYGIEPNISLKDNDKYSKMIELLLTNGVDQVQLIKLLFEQMEEKFF